MYVSFSMCEFLDVSEFLSEFLHLCEFADA